MTFAAPITNANLKIYLRITTADATFNTFLDEQIQAATDRCFNYMQQDYSPGLAQVVAMIGSGQSYIEIPWIITSGLNVATLLYTMGTVREQELGSSTAMAVVAAGKLRFQQGTRRIYNDEGWSVTKMYEIGYTTPALVVPRQIKACVMKLAAHYVAESRQLFGVLGRETDYSNVVGESQVKFVDPEESILRMLDPYVYRAQ